MNTTKPTIAMICAEYAPKPGPGPTRMAAFAKGLAENGYHPLVLTSKKISGKISSHWQEVTSPLQPTEEKAGIIGGRGGVQSWIEKLVNLLVPMEPAITLSYRSLYRVFAQLVNREKIDVIFVTCNPLASAVGGVILKRKHKIPLIVEFRDPWTLNPIRNWPTWLHYVVESGIEKWVLRSADAIIMNTPTARTNLLNKFKWLASNQVHLISHGFDGNMAEYQNKTGCGNNSMPGIIRMAYAGGFYAPHKPINNDNLRNWIRSFLNWVKLKISYNISSGALLERGSTPESILRAIKLYNNLPGNTLPKIKIEFIGGEPAHLTHLIMALDMEDQAKVIPRVAAENIRKTLTDYDLCYLTNPSIPQSPFVSTKTFDYLAACLPVVADLPDSDQARLILSAKAGWLCEPGNSQAIAATLHNILLNNRALVNSIKPDKKFIELFARHHQITDLANVIEQSLGQKTKSSIISKGYRQLQATHKYRPV